MLYVRQTRDRTREFSCLQTDRHTHTHTHTHAHTHTHTHNTHIQTHTHTHTHTHTYTHTHTHLARGVWACTRAGGAPRRLALFFLKVLMAIKTSLIFFLKNMLKVGLDRISRISSLALLACLHILMCQAPCFFLCAGLDTCDIACAQMLEASVLLLCCYVLPTQRP